MHKLLLALLGALLIVASPAAAAHVCPYPRSDHLVVGIPIQSAPLAFLNSDHNGLQGLAVDLAVRMAEEMNKRPLFVQGRLSTLERKLREGSVDAVIQLLPSGQLAPFDMDLLYTPLALNRAMLVTGSNPPLGNERDLVGLRVIVEQGDPHIPELLERGNSVIEASSVGNALDLLESGAGDVYVASAAERAMYLAQGRAAGKDIRIAGPSLERVPVVMVMRRETGMLEASNAALSTLERRGEVEWIRSRWLGRSLDIYSLWAFCRYNMQQVIIALLVIFLIALAWLAMLKKQVREVTRRLVLTDRKYRDLVQASPDIILLFDDNGRITLANRSARAALHISEDGYSSTLMQALRCQTSDCMDSVMNVIPPQGALRKEITLPAGTDDELALEANLFVTAADDESHAVCLIGRDITERRRLNQQVVEMERLAVLGKLAAGVAHEINNPVGIIMANAQLALEDCPEGSPLRPLLCAIQRNGERAVSTTRRLLNLALPDSVQHERQNLSSIIEEALSFLKPRLRSVRVDVSLMPAVLPVMGNRILLEQAVLNLLINALDSMEGRACRALAVSGACDAESTVLEISDTGSGMSEEHRKRIFDLFFSTKGSKGFGMGLYLSRHIVERHNGCLDVYSEPEAGTTMSLTFHAENIHPSEEPAVAPQNESF